MNDVNKRLNISIEWEKSKEAFKEGKTLFDADLASGAISRAYYGAFHAGKALLLSLGLEIRSHQALGKMFSLHFVKTGKFGAKYSRILSTKEAIIHYTDNTGS